MKNPTAEACAALRIQAEAAARQAGVFRWDAEGLCPDSRERLALLYRRLLRKSGAVGGMLVIVHGPHTEIFTAGQARLHPPLPVRAETCFRMASVTKLVVTFGFLSMAEEGLLSPDADVSEVFGFPVRHPRFPRKPVTARMLMTHTSGITDFGCYAKVDPEHPLPLPELLCREDCWRDSPPGDSFQYSNLGAGITGALMEKAAHLPLSEIMRRRVFSPLGIRATLDPRRVSPRSDLADGYRDTPLPFLPRICAYDAARLSARPEERFDPLTGYFAGVGRLIADGRAADQLLRLLAAKEDTSVLSLSSLREMRSLQDGRGGIAHAGRGLNTAFLPGVFPGRTLIGHQGAAYGMCAELFVDPETGDGAAVLTSGMNLRRRREPFVSGGFDLLALAFAAIGS